MSQLIESGVFGITGHPLRHVYMLGLVWKLSQANNSDPVSILEVGSWCGWSALTWGHGLEEHHDCIGSIACVDPWEPYTDTTINTDTHNIGMQKELTEGDIFEVFKNNISFIDDRIEIKIHKGKGEDVLPTLSEGSYDIVYIDGDHTYGSVSKDIALGKKLVKTGGYISGDDLEVQSHEFNRGLHISEPKLESIIDPDTGRFYHPGVTAAVAEELGKVSSWYGFWGMQKIDDGWCEFDLYGMPMRIPPRLPSSSLIELKLTLIEEGIM